VGVATFPPALIVYVAEAVLLSVIPDTKALALIVVVVLTKIRLEYTVEEDDGSDPSTVNRIVAPDVAQVSTTF
jgi:hypothetical protein